MCSVIEHRGPDSHGMFREEGVGLGIQRLAIIDLKTGDQPIFNEDESVVVVLNGEIYNYKELRTHLQSAGHRLATRTDTEVIVHLYEEYGDACVDHLRGMFAFALWDRPKRRLLIGRDRVGKKPLFYAERDGSFWFGSEAKSILEDPAIPRDVNYQAIDAFLHYQYVPHPHSAFSALRKLPPAHTLVWQDGQVTTRRYWKLSYRDRTERTSEEEMHEEIREKLLEATRLRMRSDVPVGAFLSGGVDSSATTAAMAMISEGQVKTFSIGFDVEAFDETAFARQVAERYGTDHHEFRVEPHALEVLPSLIWHYGEPFADSSAIPSFYLAKLAREHVTVALNGDGGDENFAGYLRYTASALADRLGWVPKPLARLGERAFELAGSGLRPRSWRSRFRRGFHALGRDPAERYSIWLAFFTELERRDLYRPEFLETIDDRAWLSVVQDPYDESDADNITERMLDIDLHSYLPADLLVKMDIATMAHSLEVRSPLLDHEFMEMAASMPANVKLKGQTNKKILKDALRPWLPDSVLYRPKMGFGVPIADWFRGSLKDLPGEILLDPRSLERGFFREEAVRGLIDAHRDGTADNASKLWALLQLELWLRTWVDGVGSDSPQTVAVA
jgi:asparagine synthase (glutamine-hydrolysing)